MPLAKRDLVQNHGQHSCLAARSRTETSCHGNISPKVSCLDQAATQIARQGVSFETVETRFARAIGARKQQILAEWEVRARELPGARSLTRPALLDSVPELLDQIARGLAELARGRTWEIAPPGAGAHALERLHEGFNLSQVVAEYTALRESILRALRDENSSSAAEHLVHQVIDRAIGVAVEQYSAARERSLERAQAETKQALAQLDALFEGAPTGMAFLDRELRFMRINRSLAAINGLAPEEHVGRTPAEVLAPPMALPESLLRSVLENGEPVRDLEFAVDQASPSSGAEHFLANYFPVFFGGPRIGGVGAVVVNITARKRAEKEWHRLAEILEFGDACLVLDDHFRVVFVNHNQAKLSQTPSELSLGRVLWEVWPEAANPRSKYWREYHRVMNLRVTSKFEEYYPPLDLWTDVTVYPTRHGGIAVFFRDATERKRSEEALRQSEDRHRVAVDSTGLGTWDWDLLRNELAWSDRNREIFGVAPDETPSYALFMDRLHPDDRARVGGLVQASLDPDNGGGFEMEARIVRARDGAERWIVGRGRTLFDAERRAVRMLGTTLDITESKRHALRLAFLAEATKRLSETLELERTLQAVVELAVPAIADLSVFHVLDTEGALSLAGVTHRDPELLHEVEAMANSFPDDSRSPYGPAHVARSGKPELVPELSADILRLAGVKPEHREMILKFGLRSLLSVPLQARGRTLGVWTFATSARSYDQDDLAIVSELAARAALAVDNAELYQAAQRAIRFRENVLAVVSHDLKNPLGVITMSAGLLLRKVPELASDPQLNKHLEAIHRASKRMDRLIADLLDMGSIQAGRLAMQCQWEAMPPLLQEAVMAQEAIARDKGLKLRTEFACDGAYVFCDRNRLLQVLSNLIGNAVKFSRPGDTITVAAILEGHEMICAVNDTGPGINSVDLPHVFDPYWSGRRHENQG
ncbi:MAG TPA: PAS domain-containing protein, partial [Polyangiaceae bacterium]|nr:PAS domain-containing protein [Polyangiaceae bacterium]